MNLRLPLQLGFDTLRSRPTLTVLAVLLLALGTATVGAVAGTIYLLHALRTEFLAGLTVDIELVRDTETAREAVTSRLQRWTGVRQVIYIPPDSTLQAIERETGENLLALFGVNPFPGILRVRLTGTSVTMLNELAAEARTWPEVAQVVYPQRLWNDLERLGGKVQRGLGVVAAAGVVVVLGLAGLCLRAQVRNRAATWEFLSFLGASRRVLGLSLLVQETIIGWCSGVLAGGALWLVTQIYGWLFLRNVALPLWFWLAVWLAAWLFAIMAGAFSPRRWNFSTE